MLYYFLGEPQEECARCGKNFLINGQQNDVSGLCNECGRSNSSPDNDISLNEEVDVDNEEDTKLDQDE